MLDREKQAKKQQDAEYEGAGGRANDQLKSYRLEYKALNHALASGIDCFWNQVHREKQLGGRVPPQHVLKARYERGDLEVDLLGGPFAIR